MTKEEILTEFIKTIHMGFIPVTYNEGSWDFNVMTRTDLYSLLKNNQFRFDGIGCAHVLPDGYHYFDVCVVFKDDVYVGKRIFENKIQIYLPYSDIEMLASLGFYEDDGCLREAIKKARESRIKLFQMIKEEK